jgi:hypothetical protein
MSRRGQKKGSKTNTCSRHLHTSRVICIRRNLHRTCILASDPSPNVHTLLSPLCAFNSPSPSLAPSFPLAFARSPLILGSITRAGQKSHEYGCSGNIISPRWNNILRHKTLLILLCGAPRIMFSNTVPPLEGLMYFLFPILVLRRTSPICRLNLKWPSIMPGALKGFDERHSMNARLLHTITGRSIVAAASMIKTQAHTHKH